jgi:hypothetical protein
MLLRPIGNAHCKKTFFLPISYTKNKCTADLNLNFRCKTVIVNHFSVRRETTTLHGAIRFYIWIDVRIRRHCTVVFRIISSSFVHLANAIPVTYDPSVFRRILRIRSDSLLTVQNTFVLHHAYGTSCVNARVVFICYFFFLLFTSNAAHITRRRVYYYYYYYYYKTRCRKATHSSFARPTHIYTRTYYYFI